MLTNKIKNHDNNGSAIIGVVIVVVVIIINKKIPFHDPQKVYIRLIHWQFYFRAMLVFVASPSPQKVWSVPWR